MTFLIEPVDISNIIVPGPNCDCDDIDNSGHPCFMVV